jgi:hypothetical protein
MTVVTIEEAKSRIEELAHLAAGGENIRIAVASGMLLELRPVPQALHPGQKRVGGQWEGLVEVRPDFFEPMPDDWLTEFYEGPVFPSEESDSQESAERRPR